MAKLLHRLPPDDWMRVDLDGRAVLTIGRASENDLVLRHASVSRRHARLERREDGSWCVVDLGGTNGIIVGGQRISVYELRDGVDLAFGAWELRFEEGAPAASGGLISASQALALAQQAASQDVHDLVVDTNPQEHAFGWVFNVVPRMQLQTGDPRYGIPGLGPLAVLRTGDQRWLPPGPPLNQAISELQNWWNQNAAAIRGASGVQQQVQRQPQPQPQPQPKPQPMPPRPPTPPAPPPETPEWHVSANGQQHGPMTLTQARDFIRGAPGAWVWKEGMAGWVNPYDLREFG